MDENDRRRQERYPVAIDIDITIQTPDITVSATATNISIDGLGVQALKNIPPGTQATININIPDEVVMYGNLQWSRHTLIQNLDAYQMGFDMYAIIYQGRIFDDPSKREEVIEEIIASQGRVRIEQK